MTTFTLASGDKIPAIGLGTWLSPDNEVFNAVLSAIKSGYKHIDCAAIYKNEKVIGEALQECFNKQLIARKDLWITSKLWNSYHKSDDVEKALKQTLKDLQLDYLDLYLIHWPVAFKPQVGLATPQTKEEFLSLEEAPLVETWKAMESLVKKGLVRNIGVSNFSQKKIELILKDAEYKPAVNQVECHPYLAQNELLAFCKKNHIVLTAYSPLASPGRPDVFKKDTEPYLLEDPIVVNIAKKHSVSSAQVLLAWQMSRGVVVIPKSTHAQRIEDNHQSIHLTLSEEDIKKINKLDRHYRYVDGGFFEMKGAPYNVASIWD